MADKKNKQDMKDINNYAEILKSINSNIDRFSKEIYGTDGYDNLESLKKDVLQLTKFQTDEIGGNILNKIREREKNKNSAELRNYDRIKESITNNTDPVGLNTLVSNLDGKIGKYEDLLIITKMMPQLKEAKKNMVNSIMSPDDFTKQLSLSIELNGKPLSEEDPSLNLEIKNILESYEYVKEIKHTIDRVLTFGCYFDAVLPYEKLYNDLLINKAKRAGNLKIKESTERVLTENDVILDESAFANVSSKELTNLKKDILTICNNMEIYNESSSSNLFNESVLAESLKREVKKKSNIDIDISDDLKTKFNPKQKEFNNGLLSINNYKEQDLGINGCKIKRLDPRRTLKLEIDKTVLGYYYIETMESLRIIQNPGTFNLSNTYNVEQQTNSVDALYKSLGDLLMKKLDKDFIKDNSDIKEELYDILKYADAANHRVKIIYLDPEDVQEFEIDDEVSMFEEALFFAKLYLMLLLTNIAAKVSRSNDVRVYNVKTDAHGRVDQMVSDAVKSLRKNNRSFYSLTNLGKMISSFNQFDDIMVPLGPNDTKALDFDIIQGQDVDMNETLMEMLEKICVESTGTPLALLQSSNEVEFARTYSVLNLKYMRSVLDKQIDLNPDNENFIKKILRADIGNSDQEKLNKINNLSIKLQSPMNLLLTNALEQINNAKELANSLGEILLGQSNTDDKLLEKFILVMCKKYAPNVPFDDFEAIIKDLKVQLSSEPNNNDDDSYTE